MKYFLPIFLVFVAGGVSAQSFGISEKRARLEDVRLKDSSIQKKWFISSYASVAAGFIGFNGGGASYVAAPIGMQLNRVLDNNWTAFAGLSIAPTYLLSQHGFAANGSKNFSNSFMAGNPSRFHVNPAAYVGIGYTNDEKTFSIQGRIIVEKGNYFTDPSGFGSSCQLDRQMNNLPFRGRPMTF